MANNKDAYKTWRTANGKLVLEPQKREDVCKLDAEGYSFTEMRKFIDVSEEELKEFRVAHDYQARMKTLKKLAAETRELWQIPETPEEMRKYAIRSLIRLCRKGTKADGVKVQASKALLDAALEASLIKEPEKPVKPSTDLAKVYGK